MSNVRGKSLAASVLSGALLGVLVTGAGAYGFGGHGHTLAASAGKGLARIPSCAQYSTPLYVVAKTADPAAGFPQTAGLLVAANHLVDRGVQPTVIMNATKADGMTQVAPASISSISGVLSSAVVYAQSSDPNLRSCDHKLSDRPEDQTLVSAAQAALVHAGLATAGQVNGPGVLDFVSDDPLDASRAIVTVDVPSTVTLADGTQTASLQHLVAFVHKGDDSVSQTDVVPSV